MRRWTLKFGDLFSVGKVSAKPHHISDHHTQNAIARAFLCNIIAAAVILPRVSVQAFIPQEKGLHWSGVVVDMDTHVIQYYDPNGTDGQPTESLETVNLVRRWVG